MPALALEYLPHGDLVPLLGAASEQWLPAFRSVVAALARSHRHGFAHGDVKPRNVLFAADGSARLIDFSSARPLESPAAASTAAYGLPARLLPSARDADCFALAVLLFELATGRLPYGPAGPNDVADAGRAGGLRPAPGAVASRGRHGAASAGRVGSPAYFLDVIESSTNVTR